MVDVTTYTSSPLRFHVNAVDRRPLSAAFINGGKHLVIHDSYGKLSLWESASANLLWSIESGCCTREIVPLRRLNILIFSFAAGIRALAVSRHYRNFPRSDVIVCVVL
jgi:hypothetical protein